MHLLAYRSSKHEVTGASPLELYFARDLRLPLDLLRGSPPGRGEEDSFESYVLKLKRRLNDIHNNARQCLNLQSLYSKVH